jgi:hypothetical protein
MTDPVPSKDQLRIAELEAECNRWADLSNQRDDREHRLRTALRGIQSCSSCEACRGAAALALSGAAPACNHPWDKVGVSGDGKPFCAQCCTNLVKDPPWVTAPEPSPEQVLERGRQVEEQGLRLRHRVAEHPVPRTGFVLVWHEDRGKVFPIAWSAPCYHHAEMGASLYPPAITWEVISAPESPQPPGDGQR